MNITISKGRVHMKDFATFSIQASKSEADATLIKDNMGGESPTIIIRLAATHSGKYNKNHRFYIPDKVKAGTDSWTANFGKPILVHHDEKTDAIGRVLSAKYVDLGNRFMDAKLNDSTFKIADKKFWDELSSPNISLTKKVRMIKAADAIIRDSDFPGVGYIELTAHITDPDAVQKVKDRRYLTGSVGASSNHAICNICQTDWATDGRCDHDMGEVYDGVKAGLIFGDLDYEEWSFVNNPADVKSSVLDLKNTTERVFDLTVSDQLEEKERMAVNIKDFTEDEVEKLLDKAIKAEALSEEEQDSLYELLASEIESEVITDAKLSSEKRKTLPSSAFCGPNKSFPAHDCAHVVAARRLIGRYKGEGDKDSILKCIDRKALALGCDSAKDTTSENVSTQKVSDNVETEALVTSVANLYTIPKDAVGDTLKAFFDNDEGKALLSKLIEAGLVLDLTVESSLKDSIAKLESEKAELLSTKDAAIETATSEMKTQLKALRFEMKSLFDDAIALEDQVLKLTVENRKLKVDKLETLHTLSGNLTDEVKKSFIKLNDDALDSEISNIGKKVDITKFVDKLTSDTNSQNIEKVSFPTGESQAATEAVTNKPTYATQAFVDENYRKILIQENNPQKANAYYQDSVAKGLATARN